MFHIRKAVVTGGSSGIGKALVDTLLREGCEVFSLSRTIRSRDFFVQMGELHQIACDITDGRAVENAFSQIAEQTDFFDVLFSNAGYGISGSVVDTPKEQIARQFDVNVFAAVEVIQQSIPFLARGKGRIVLTSSVAAVVSLPYQSFYSATKASLNMLALALNTELKPYGTAPLLSARRADTPREQGKTRVKRLLTDRCQRSVARMEHDERTGVSPALIAERFVRIAKKNAPKPLYGIGLFYRLVLLLFKILPVRFANWVVGRMYG